MPRDAFAYFHNFSYALLFLQDGKDASNAFHTKGINLRVHEDIALLVDSFQQQQMNKSEYQKVK
jgi:hypothetical protein